MSNNAMFPRPARLPSGTSAWSLSQLEAFDAMREGREPRAVTPGDERYLRVGQVAARYSVSVPTVWRWASLGARPADEHERDAARAAA